MNDKATEHLLGHQASDQPPPNIMTTILRRSGAFPRRSTSSRNPCLRSRLPLYPALWNISRVTSPQSRQYATINPGDPKDPKEREKNASSEHGKSVARNAKSPGKPARGFEQLYGDNGVMSSTSSSGKEASKKAKLPDGPMLTQDEMEAVDSLVSMCKRGMPTEQANMIARSFENIKREGIPPELREILDARKSGKPFDIATMARLVRVATRMARQSAEREFNRQQENVKSDASASSKTDKQQSSQGSQGSQGSRHSKGFKFNDIKLDNQTFLLTAFVTYMLYRTIVPGDNSKEITWQEFQTTFFDKGLVEKLTVINRALVKVSLHREATVQMYPESPAQNANFYYYFTIGSVEAFERKLDQAQQDLGIPQSDRIPVAYTDRTSWYATFLHWAPLLILFTLPYILSKRGGGSGMGGSSGLFGIGKSRAKKFNHDSDVKVKFKDVAGMDEAKAEIMEFVSFLREPGQYSRLGAKIPRGAILSGPPGTGKTLLAKATAGESGVPFFSVSGSEFVEMFVGVGPSRVRDLFANARKNTPCIIFIDEIDAIGKKRGQGVFGGDSEREATLNQILTEMDGFNTSEQVVVLAGTNRPDVLDNALMRPGRFDRHINIDAPTMEGRKQIFKVHVGKIVTDEDVEYMTGRLAALTPGFSGADIANCVNEAALTGMHDQSCTEDREY